MRNRHLQIRIECCLQVFTHPLVSDSGISDAGLIRIKGDGLNIFYACYSCEGLKYSIDGLEGSN